MLREGLCWTVSDDVNQQNMLTTSIKLAKKNCKLPTCVITSDANLVVDVDELIYIPKGEYHPRYDIFTKLKHCPWDLINYVSCRCMIINPLHKFTSEKQAQFLIRPNILAPNKSVYPTVTKKWFVDRSWFKLTKYHLESLEYSFTGSRFSDVEQPLTEWVDKLSNKTLHKDLWFPSGYKDMHEIRKWIGLEPSKSWLGIPSELFKLRPIFEVSENAHFKEFLNEF